MKALANLARATPNDQNFAHQHLFRQVTSCQRNRSHPEWYAKEVLPSDLNEVRREIWRLTKAGLYKRQPRPGRSKGANKFRELRTIRPEDARSVDEDASVESQTESCEGNQNEAEDDAQDRADTAVQDGSEVNVQSSLLVESELGGGGVPLNAV